MLFGHNTNVKVGETTYHVQTEDRGTANALIDTTVYFRGRVLHRLTNNYFDLLPMNPDRERALKLRVNEQHSTVIEEIRKGALNLPLPPEVLCPAATTEASDSPSAPKVLALELVNAKSWLSGKRATLQISVRNRDNGHAVGNARVAARIDGAAEAEEFRTETGSDGRAQLEFDMPRLTGSEPALVIEAFDGNAKGSLRFQLRAKPRVPSAS
jgi:hypothetical protein